MRRIAVYFIIMLLAVSCCAVLTPSQRSEVEKFGKAQRQSFVVLEDYTSSISKQSLYDRR